MKLSIIAVSTISIMLYAEEQPIFALLNEDMFQAAQMATQNNQNIDYQPFILSILHGDDLLKFGIKTLGESLILIPGVDMATNTMNNRTPIFRGSNPTAYGQSTLVIDGIVLNESLFSNFNAYLDMPIELIERIEVVRGSGSFIEGVNGYAATINVITRAKSNLLNNQKGALYGSVGSNNAIASGGWSQYNGNNWQLALDVFAQRHDQRTPIKVKDGYNASISPANYAPLGMEHTGVGATYTYKNFELQGRINQYKSDSAFGNLNALPNLEGQLQQPSWYLQGKYTLLFNPTTDIVFKTSIMEDSWKSDARVLPVGYSSFVDGYWASLMIKFRHINGSTTIHYNGIDSHNITAGIESSWHEAIDMKTVGNKIPALGVQDYTTSSPFIYADQAKRQNTNLYLSDNMHINDYLAFAFTLGEMLTSDVESHPYGRVALIYQPTHTDIVKIMGAYGIRYPSFQEMYVTPSAYATGNPNLNPEYVKSIEAQYIHKLNTSLSAGFNLFYLRNEQQIVRDQTNKFQNIGRNHIIGGEAELRGKLTSDDTCLLSYSYIYGKVKEINESESTLPYTATHLIKAAYSYDFIDRWSVGSIWNYVGKKERYSADPREALKSYNTLDVALSWNID
ncbi:TonB-dependent receptor plug domain-containing protein, partial [Sulfuricurvum sp.]|uniref:TonB-dependent receptor plug domain-containing protein n=1 Tax=Sulfuricurvum sp. TaxID=2025608 RepID=UPI003BB795DB